MTLKKRPKMKTTGLYLPEEIYTKLKELAEKEGVSINSAMAQLIERGMACNKGNVDDVKCA